MHEIQGNTGSASRRGREVRNQMLSSYFECRTRCQSEWRRTVQLTSRFMYSSEGRCRGNRLLSSASTRWSTGSESGVFASSGRLLFGKSRFIISCRMIFSRSASSSTPKSDVGERGRTRRARRVRCWRMSRTLSMDWLKLCASVSTLHRSTI